MTQLLASVGATVAEGAIDTVEQRLDELEEALVTFSVEAAREAERAERFRGVGRPSENAEPYTESFSRFLVTPASASRTKEVVRLLDATAARWAKQMTSAPLAEAQPDALSLYFEEEGVPLRLDIGIANFEDGEAYDESTLIAAVAHEGEISVRPQTMGDDLLATLRIRRDPTFDDEPFDTTYFVSGAESDLRALLTPVTCAHLMNVARTEPATIHVAAGRVTMRLGRAQTLAGAVVLLARFGT